MTEIRAGDGRIIYQTLDPVGARDRLSELRVLLETAHRHDVESRDGAPGWYEQVEGQPPDPRRAAAVPARDAALTAFAHNALELAPALAWHLPQRGEQAPAQDLAEQTGERDGMLATCELLEAALSNLLATHQDAVSVERVQRWVTRIRAGARTESELNWPPEPPPF
jgi:hypothetical protein